MENSMFETNWVLKQNYQNMLKSAWRLLELPFYRGFYKNEKEPGASFQAKFFVEFFDEFFYFVIWHKRDKLH